MIPQETVTIPQKVYDRAYQLAVKRNQAVADVLAAALELVDFQDNQTPNEALQMAHEETAFQNMLPELLANYEGKYVALYQGKLIDHDQDELA